MLECDRVGSSDERLPTETLSWAESVMGAVSATAGKRNSQRKRAKSCEALLSFLLFRSYRISSILMLQSHHLRIYFLTGFIYGTLEAFAPS
jgi:hypothetical protein